MRCWVPAEGDSRGHACWGQQPGWAQTQRTRAQGPAVAAQGPGPEHTSSSISKTRPGATLRAPPTGQPTCPAQTGPEGCPDAAIPGQGHVSAEPRACNFSNPWAGATAPGTAGLEFSVGMCDLGSEKHPTKRNEPLCREILKSDVPFSCGCRYLSSSGSRNEKGNRDAPHVPLRPWNVPARDPHMRTGVWHLNLPAPF